MHAKYLGHPLFGDEAYGGAGTTAIQQVAKKGGMAKQTAVRELVKAFARPALHAKTLGFVHPGTGQSLSFDSPLPKDFSDALEALRRLD